MCFYVFETCRRIERLCFIICCGSWKYFVFNQTSSNFDEVGNIYNYQKTSVFKQISTFHFNKTHNPHDFNETHKPLGCNQTLNYQSTPQFNETPKSSDC